MRFVSVTGTKRSRRRFVLDGRLFILQTRYRQVTAVSRRPASKSSVRFPMSKREEPREGIAGYTEKERESEGLQGVAKCFSLKLIKKVKRYVSVCFFRHADFAFDGGF